MQPAPLVALPCSEDVLAAVAGRRHLSLGGEVVIVASKSPNETCPVTGGCVVRHTYASPNLPRVLGYEVETFLGFTFADLLEREIFEASAMAGELGDNFRAWIANELAAGAVTRARMRNGATGAWHEMEAVLELIPSNPNDVLIVLRDVTSENQLAALQRNQTYAGKMLDVTHDIMLVVSPCDGDFVHEYVSPSVERIFGLPAHEYEASTFKQLLASGHIHPDDVGPGTEAGILIATAMDPNATFPPCMTAIARHKNHCTDEWRHMELVVTQAPVNFGLSASNLDATKTDASPPPRRFVIMMCDVTDRVERHRLEAENARLETEREQKQRFADMVNHDVKNRLLAVNALSDQLLRTVHQHAPHILGSPVGYNELHVQLGYHLERGIRVCNGHALTWQLAQGMYEPVSEPVALIAELKKFCSARTVISAGPDVDAVRIDLDLLLLVLDNAETNSIRYGDPLIPPRLHVRVVRATPPTLVFELENAPGPNHAALYKAHGCDTSPLFESGVRGVTSTDEAQVDAARRVSNGEGLHIARLAAKALGGTMRLRIHSPGGSNKGVGATFICEIPYLPQLASSCIRFPPGMRMDSLDDDEYVRKSDDRLRSHMGIDGRSYGASVFEIETFVDAVVSAHQPPTIVIVDTMLDDPSRPGMAVANGIDVVVKLRARGYEGWIVGRSANYTTPDCERMRTAGADGCIPKGLPTQSTIARLAAIMRLDNVKEAIPPPQKAETVDAHGSSEGYLKLARDGGGVTPSPPRLRRNDSLDDCAERVETKRRALKVVLTDDDPTSRTLATLMAKRIGAEEPIALGANADEIHATVGVATGRLSPSLTPLSKDAPARSHADLTILDHQLGVGVPDGGQIARDLRVSGYEGVIAISTAASGEQLTRIRASNPEADVVVAKGDKTTEDTLMRLLAKRLAASSANTPRDSADGHSSRSLLDPVLLDDIGRDALLELLPPLLAEGAPASMHKDVEALADNIRCPPTDDDEWVAIAARCHRLRGSTVQLGLVELSCAWRRAQHAAQRRDVEGLCTIICRLQKTLEATVAALVERGDLKE